MTPEEATSENPIRLTGTITWLYHSGGSDSAPVPCALIRGPHQMVVECLWQGEPFGTWIEAGDEVRIVVELGESSQAT